MKYKCFLFDWDGSLANTLPIWFAGYKKIFAKHGIEVDNEVIAREVLGDWEGPRRLGIVNEEEFFMELENEVMEQLNAAKLNPDVYETLTLIKQSGGKIGVVTASKKRWVKGALRNNGLRDLVDVFLGKEDVLYVKPDPESLLKAMNLMGAKKEETVMVGDSQKDILAAKRAGVESCLYFPKKYEEFYDAKFQRSLGATKVIEDFKELEKFV
jgi:pyrophosphatase PpaX